jgi:hypothetical protein
MLSTSFPWSRFRSRWPSLALDRLQLSHLCDSLQLHLSTAATLDPAANSMQQPGPPSATAGTDHLSSTLSGANGWGLGARGEPVTPQALHAELRSSLNAGRYASVLATLAQEEAGLVEAAATGSADRYALAAVFDTGLLAASKTGDADRALAIYATMWEVRRGEAGTPGHAGANADGNMDGLWHKGLWRNGAEHEHALPLSYPILS